MTIEVATFLADLVASNPGAGDLVAQGDDHLRLLKAVLQSTFPSLGKAIYFPTTAAKSADFTVLAADMNKTFVVTTTGGLVNMTLPTLASGDAGWECFMIKSTDTNPVMIKPPSGTLNSGAIPGLAAARRAIPNSKISCYWTGSVWVISRAASVAGPVGSCIEYHGTTLPFGFEWPNGQTLASVATAYPEYNAVIGSGVTVDKRGRFAATLDNLGGSAASRITTAGGAVDGATQGAVGGGQNVTLVTANLPPITVAGTVSITGISMTIPVRNFTNIGGTDVLKMSLSGSSGTDGGTFAPTFASATATFTGTPTGGTSAVVKTLPPTIMLPAILVVE